jgi:AcrR family transcriptional regulator
LGAPEEHVSTRERLIGATERLLREGGLSAVTTQSVAQKAGLAEGTIYRHFDCRDSLVACTIEERVPAAFEHLIDTLMKSAGHSQVEDNLRDFLAGALPFFAVIAPFVGMLAANPAVALRHSEMMREKGKGPRRAAERLQAYFREEQRLGRIRQDIDVRGAGALLVGVCFHHSLMTQLFGEDPNGVTDDELPAAVAGVLSRGLECRRDGERPQPKGASA